nr:MAG TPA: hypothetical protein [Caudoviricetes sp.]DAW74831.1 MAG TPA: hypothetical protein [Ackermannviridae sp.]
MVKTPIAALSYGYYFNIYHNLDKFPNAYYSLIL